MDFTPLHRWDLDAQEARDLQRELAGRVETTTPLGAWETVAAADVSYDLGGDTLYAAVVVTRAGTGEVVEKVGVTGPAQFPYVPGLLSFREAPPLLDAFAKLKTRPDVVLCDGQGIAHPRRFGVACHLGLWLGVPTIGCAKSRLVGRYAEPGPDRGDRSPLTDRGDVIGAVVRTRSRVQPLFVSPGHLCDIDGAVEVVLETARKYRLPAPARLAHEFVNELRRRAGAGEGEASE